ncbi:uncharacterized protein [Phyllobates terribilis]|uniref:uncharacterized protein isoform X2 n=1 Tax=Phyllobates terribilis TaxID=111132 RepID=UPI003CCAAEF6
MAKHCTVERRSCSGISNCTDGFLLTSTLKEVLHSSTRKRSRKHKSRGNSSYSPSPSVEIVSLPDADYSDASDVLAGDSILDSNFTFSSAEETKRTDADIRALKTHTAGNYIELWNL